MRYTRVVRGCGVCLLWAAALSGCSVFVGDDAPGMGDLTPKRMFITSASGPGELDELTGEGLGGADLQCTDAATAANLDGNFGAWLSTSTLDAIDRLPTGSFWTLVDGETVVFPSHDALADGPATEIDMDENGNAVATQSVWTGTRADGTSSGEDCNEWTERLINGVPRTATIGRSNALGGEWTDADVGDCTLRLRLYCFEM